jgi:hypothetical protein
MRPVLNEELLAQKIDNTRFTVEWLLATLDENDDIWKATMRNKTLKGVIICVPYYRKNSVKTPR